MLLKAVRSMRKALETIEDLLDDAEIPDPLEETPFTVIPPEVVTGIRQRLADAPLRRFKFAMKEGPGADALVHFFNHARGDVSQLLHAHSRQAEQLRQVMDVLLTAERKANLLSWPNQTHPRCRGARDPDHQPEGAGELSLPAGGPF